MLEPGIREASDACLQAAGTTALAESILARSRTSAVVQNDLWTTADTPRSKALMRAVDAINERHGREAIKLAGSGIERGWRLRSEQRSARFTTHWDELSCVYG